MTVKELREQLRSYGLKVGGLKSELIKRLNLHKKEVNNLNVHPNKKRKTLNKSEIIVNDEKKIEKDGIGKKKILFTKKPIKL